MKFKTKSQCHIIKGHIVRYKTILRAILKNKGAEINIAFVNMKSCDVLYAGLVMVKPERCCLTRFYE